MDLAKERLGLETMARMFKPVYEWKTEPVHVNGVPGEWLIPKRAAGGRTVLYLHGGFYILGSLATHRCLAGNITAAGQARALVIDYRLAPEHPFPAGLEDAYTAYTWLLAGGARPEQIILAGDSAGGGLVLSLLLTLRERGTALPAAAVCLSPLTDLTYSGKSWKANVKKELGINPYVAQAVPSLYIPGEDPHLPLASPLFADLHGLPPLLIQVGSAEILLSDSTRLADCAGEAGVEVTLEVWQNVPHVWQAGASILPEARQAVGKIGEYIAAHGAPPP